jgi:hypothetical protein
LVTQLDFTSTLLLMHEDNMTRWDFEQLCRLIGNDSPIGIVFYEKDLNVMFEMNAKMQHGPRCKYYQGEAGGGEPSGGGVFATISNTEGRHSPILRYNERSELPFQTYSLSYSTFAQVVAHGMAYDTKNCPIRQSVRKIDVGQI